MIFFDNASTTLPCEDVLKEFVRASNENFANPGSNHRLGVDLQSKLYRIRTEICKTLGLNSSDYDVIFTSGATEANNLAIQGFVSKNKNRFKHIMTSEMEHSSVLEVFKHLESEGYKVDFIKVTSEGVLDLEDLKNHLDGKPVFCSFMGCCNETGTVNDLNKIKEIIGADSILHSDLTQAIGKAKIDIKCADMFNFTSHKIYGLKGCGCLIKKKKVNINPVVFGGHQENDLRSGTVDFPSISAFNVAIKNIISNFENDDKHIREIRNFLVSELSKIDEVILHDYPSCESGILNISTKTKKASVVVEYLSNKEIYVSSVSACYSKGEPSSHVIFAITHNQHEASNTIRISLAKYNTLDEAKIFINEFKSALANIRS